MRTEVVFTFQDTRNAIGGEKALQDAGIAVRIMSRPSVLGEGCGICLRVNCDARTAAETILRERGIVLEAAYFRENGVDGVLYRVAE